MDTIQLEQSVMKDVIHGSRWRHAPVPRLDSDFTATPETFAEWTHPTEDEVEYEMTITRKVSRMMTEAEVWELFNRHGLRRARVRPMGLERLD